MVEPGLDPHVNPLMKTTGIRLKGNTVRLVSAVLAGLVLLLLAGVLGMALGAAAVAALAVAALVWLSWIGLKRAYWRLIRPST